MPPTTGAEKRKVFEEMLARGAVSVHFDARCKGAFAPHAFEEVLVTATFFEHHYHMKHLDDDGIEAQLIQDERTADTVRIPWAAVYAIVDGDGRGKMFEEEWPDELPMPGAAQLGMAPPSKEGMPPRKKRPTGFDN